MIQIIFTFILYLISQPANSNFSPNSYRVNILAQCSSAGTVSKYTYVLKFVRTRTYVGNSDGSFFVLEKHTQQSVEPLSLAFERSETESVFDDQARLKSFSAKKSNGTAVLLRVSGRSSSLVVKVDPQSSMSEMAIEARRGRIICTHPEL